MADSMEAVGARKPKASPIGPFQGLRLSGNVDLEHRPLVNMPGGGVGTVYSGTYRFGNRWVLLPKISPDGQLLDHDQTIELFRRTGQHLGYFDSSDEADSYAEALHKRQEQFYNLGDK